MSDDNPFLALFEPLKDNQAEQIPEASKVSKNEDRKEVNTKFLQRINQIIEDVFAITINPYSLLGRSDGEKVKKSGLVLLESMSLSVQHDQAGRSWMDLDLLPQALFERLLLAENDLKKSLISDGNISYDDCHPTDSRPIVYLAECYLRCHARQSSLEKLVSLD